MNDFLEVLLKDGGTCWCFWELGEWTDDSPRGGRWEDWVNGVEFEVERKMVWEVSKEVVMKRRESRTVEDMIVGWDRRMLKEWGEEFGGESKSTVVEWKYACFCAQTESWTGPKRSCVEKSFGLQVCMGGEAERWAIVEDGAYESGVKGD